MLIADAQVHIWAADTPDRPWPAIGHSYAHRDTPLGHAALLREMDAAGVDRVVIVPPSWEGDRNDLALAVPRDGSITVGAAVLHFSDIPDQYGRCADIFNNDLLQVGQGTYLADTPDKVSVVALLDIRTTGILVVLF